MQNNFNSIIMRRLLLIFLPLCLANQIFCQEVSPRTFSEIKDFLEEWKYQHMFHDQSESESFMNLFENSAVSIFNDLKLSRQKYVTAKEYVDNINQGIKTGRVVRVIVFYFDPIVIKSYLEDNLNIYDVKIRKKVRMTEFDEQSEQVVRIVKTQAGYKIRAIISFSDYQSDKLSINPFPPKLQILTSSTGKYTYDIGHGIKINEAAWHSAQLSYSLFEIKYKGFQIEPLIGVDFQMISKTLEFDHGTSLDIYNQKDPGESTFTEELVFLSSTKDKDDHFSLNYSQKGLGGIMGLSGKYFLTKEISIFLDYRYIFGLPFFSEHINIEGSIESKGNYKLSLGSLGDTLLYQLSNLPDYGFQEYDKFSYGKPTETKSRKFGRIEFGLNFHLLENLSVTLGGGYALARHSKLDNYTTGIRSVLDTEGIQIDKLLKSNIWPEFDAQKINNLVLEERGGYNEFYGTFGILLFF
jgi:hypothetical protein